MSQENTIYYLKLEDINNEDIIKNHIYPDLNSNYYFSDDFSEEFYVKLASLGFISTTTIYQDYLYLLPELQFEYAVLHFENLHISKKVNKLIKKNNYQLVINKNVDLVLKKLDEYHEPNWLINEYQELIKKLLDYKDPSIDFELKSFELLEKNTNKLIAAEIGYKIGSTYTSLTGFSTKDKEHRNCGKLQLVLLAKYLEENNYDFWNLGHPYMQYKFDLGAKEYKRAEFLKIWEKSVNKSNN